MLARDVTLFQMEFYDSVKGEWLDEWRYTNQLPKLVKIALGLGKSAKNPSNPYDLVTTLVALPSVGVGGELQGAGPPPPGGARGGTPGAGGTGAGVGTGVGAGAGNGLQNQNQRKQQGGFTR